MNQLVFWKNIGFSSSDIDSLIKSNAALFMPHHVYTRLDDNCGLITVEGVSRPIVMESDDAILCSLHNDVQYKTSHAEEAAASALADFTSSQEPDFSSFVNRFSILHYNKKNGHVNAAIDRFGIERLYYYSSGDSLLCATSLDTLLLFLPKDIVQIYNQAIYHYIYFHVIPSPHTIYDNIYKIEPGQRISFWNRKLNKKPYWLPSFNENQTDRIELLEGKTRELLQDAVAKNNVSKSTGSFLSGGLDSSTVSGLLAKVSKRTVKTYTMGFNEAGYDETAYAKIASQHFRTDLRSYYVTPNDVASAFSRVTTFFEEPFGNSSAVPAYLCAQFAKDDGMTSLLAGDGGDEIFSGNERYAKQLLFEHYSKIPVFLRKSILEPLFNNNHFYNNYPPFSKVKSYIEQCLTPMPDRMERYNFINHFDANAIFDDAFLSSVDTDLPISEKRNIYLQPDNASLLNRMLYMDWKFTLADNDLVKVSKTAELANIEVRYPMLNDDLVKMSTKIPSAVKMKGQHLRSFYKGAFKDFLPDEVINKPKHGFGLPFGEWLKKSPDLQDHIYDNLNALKKRNYIDSKFIDNIIHIHRTDSAASYFGTMVWILAVLEEWLSSRSI